MGVRFLNPKLPRGSIPMTKKRLNKFNLLLAGTVLMAFCLICGLLWLFLPGQLIQRDTYVDVSKLTYPYLSRRPADANWYRGELTALPAFDPQSTNPFQVDLRSFDISKLDLRDQADKLSEADFDSKTIWPPAEKLPASFDREKLVELGKNPGLGVRQLHQQGITGKGVSIAIIDQALLVDHVEYADRLQLYEEAGEVAGWQEEAQMHAPAVASIAVGKTVGVAPEADLYFWAKAGCYFKEIQNLTCAAQSIQRMLDVNRSLPPEKKIRVLSMSFGWVPFEPGYYEIEKVIQEAKKEGIFVVSSNLQEHYGFRFQGLGRDPLADPEQVLSYGPGSWWQGRFWKNGLTPDTLLIPMDSRATAGPNNKQEYTFYRQGGWSWSIPYIAGLYALAVQVDPAVTPQTFWAAALKTGLNITATRGEMQKPLGPVVNPPALIRSLMKE
jgi:hypothetical protein